MVSVLLDPIDKYDNDRPFDRWLEDFDDFVLASFGEIPEKRKKAILMQMIGLEVKKYADSLTTETRASYKDLTEALVAKFNHQANETIERHIFNSMAQEDENIDFKFTCAFSCQKTYLFSKVKNNTEGCCNHA